MHWGKLINSQCLWQIHIPVGNRYISLSWKVATLRSAYPYQILGPISQPLCSSHRHMVGFIYFMGWAWSGTEFPIGSALLLIDNAAAIKLGRWSLTGNFETRSPSGPHTMWIIIAQIWVFLYLGNDVTQYPRPFYYIQLLPRESSGRLLNPGWE